jgi:hypothetical protein
VYGVAALLTNRLKPGQLTTGPGLPLRLRRSLSEPPFDLPPAWALKVGLHEQIGIFVTRHSLKLDSTSAAITSATWRHQLKALSRCPVLSRSLFRNGTERNSMLYNTLPLSCPVVP